MNTSKSFLIVFLLLSFNCFSQQVENVDFTVKDNVVIVTYDLVNCQSSELYDIKLTFVSESRNIYPNSITGDINSVSAGENKKIEWMVLSDKAELKGNIQAIVEISHIYYSTVEISNTYSTKITGSPSKSTKTTGGPSNVFLSMILPGLGDIKVDKENDKRHLKWYHISGIYLGAALCAYSYKLRSNKFYDEYLNSTTQSQIDGAYKSANDRHHAFLILVGVAGTVWLGDVIYVTVKGFKNRHEQLRHFSQNSPKINLYFVGTSKSFQIGLVKKF